MTKKPRRRTVLLTDWSHVPERSPPSAAAFHSLLRLEAAAEALGNGKRRFLDVWVKERRECSEAMGAAELVSLKRRVAGILGIARSTVDERFRDVEALFSQALQTVDDASLPPRVALGGIAVELPDYRDLFESGPFSTITCPNRAELRALLNHCRGEALHPSSPPTEQIRWLTYHVNKCEACNVNYHEMREGTPRPWSREDELRFGSMLRHSREAHDRLEASIHQAIRDGTPVELVCPTPAEMVDRSLAETISLLKGSTDEYLSLSSPFFWRSIGRSVGDVRHSEFFHATVEALTRGVRVRRVFPIPREALRLLFQLRSLLASGSYFQLPKLHAFLGAHCELAAGYPQHYGIRFRIFDGDLVQHSSIFLQRSTGSTSAYVPLYKEGELTSLAFEPAGEAIAMEFEDVWRTALDVNRFWETASPTLDGIPYSELEAALLAAGTELGREARNFMQRRWQAEGGEGNCSLYERIYGV